MNMGPDICCTSCAVGRSRFVVWASEEHHYSLFYYFKGNVTRSVPPFRFGAFPKGGFIKLGNEQINGDVARL